MGVDVDIEPKLPIKSWVVRICTAQRFVGRRHEVLVIELHNFLLRVIWKADRGGVGAQSKVIRNVLQRTLCAARPAAVGGLKNHDGVTVHRGQDDPEGFGLAGLGHVPAAGQRFIVDQLTIIIEQTVEPFNVLGRDPHACASEICSQARLIMIRRFSARRSASSGTPRAMS